MFWVVSYAKEGKENPDPAQVIENITGICHTHMNFLSTSLLNSTTGLVMSR